MAKDGPAAEEQQGRKVRHVRGREGALPAPVRVGDGSPLGFLSGVLGKCQPGCLLAHGTPEWDSCLFLNLKPVLTPCHL